MKTSEAYYKRMIEGYICPIVFCRTTKEDAEVITDRVLRKGVLCAEVKSYDDWSDPKWKIGDGKSLWKDLPYCSGPPSLVIEGVVPSPMIKREAND